MQLKLSKQADGTNTPDTQRLCASVPAAIFHVLSSFSPPFLYATSLGTALPKLSATILDDGPEET